MRLIRDRCGDGITKSSCPGPLAFENTNPDRLGGRGSPQHGAPVPPERHLKRTACQRQTSVTAHAAGNVCPFGGVRCKGRATRDVSPREEPAKGTPELGHRERVSCSALLAVYYRDGRHVITPPSKTPPQPEGALSDRGVSFPSHRR